MKSKSLKLAAAVLAVGIISTAAKADLSGNVAIQSDYVWRGYSQNSGDPSIQGGFDFEDKSGFYAGLWGASVDFGGPETTEGDIYLGFSNEIEGGFEYDVGIIEYTYHGGSGANDSNFTEYYIGGSYSGFGLTYSLGDEFGDNVEASYGYGFEGFSVGVAYGDYEDAWAYWTVGVSGEFEGGIGWDVSVWDTDLDNDPLGDTRVVLTFSKSL